MKMRISQDARPQAMTLLLAAVLSIALWFIPFADILSYPFRIFVTFIHEGGHAIAALVTGNSVQSLSVAMNASGETYTTQGGMFSQMLVSSAGYLGAMTFGALLLVLIRKAVAARIVLAGSALLILILTTVFGLITPMVAGSWGSLTGIPFTFLRHRSGGRPIRGGQICQFARRDFCGEPAGCPMRPECLAGSEDSLLSVVAFGAAVRTDAANMASATGIPAVIWTIVWIVVAFGILLGALRLYVAARDRAFDAKKDMDSPFEQKAEA